VVLAVFLRSHARLTTYDPIPTQGLDVKGLLERITMVLDGRG
jgi:hypothetical protein